MPDPDWFKPNRPPDLPRESRCAELLFEFHAERDDARWVCELREHPEPYGVEAQFYRNQLFSSSRRFDRTMSRELTPREMAIAWAHEWRKVLDREKPTDGVAVRGWPA